MRLNLSPEEWVDVEEALTVTLQTFKEATEDPTCPDDLRARTVVRINRMKGLLRKIKAKAPLAAIADGFRERWS